MWKKTVWIGHPMRLELTREVLLTNHYTTSGVYYSLEYAIHFVGLWVWIQSGFSGREYLLTKATNPILSHYLIHIRWRGEVLRYTLRRECKQVRITFETGFTSSFSTPVTHFRCLNHHWWRSVQPLHHFNPFFLAGFSISSSLEEMEIPLSKSYIWIAIYFVFYRIY